MKTFMIFNSIGAQEVRLSNSLLCALDAQSENVRVNLLLDWLWNVPFQGK